MSRNEPRRPTTLLVQFERVGEPGDAALAPLIGICNLEVPLLRQKSGLFRDLPLASNLQRSTKVTKLFHIGSTVLLAWVVAGCAAPVVGDEIPLDESAAPLREYTLYVRASKPTATAAGSSFKPFALTAAVPPDVVTMFAADGQALAAEPGGVLRRSLSITTGGTSTCVRAWLRIGSAELPLTMAILGAKNLVDPCSGKTLATTPIDLDDSSTAASFGDWVYHPDFGWYWVSYEG